MTSKAKQLLELVPEDLKKPELTADWEMRLSRIAQGKLKKNIFLKDIKTIRKKSSERSNPARELSGMIILQIPNARCAEKGCWQ